MYRQVGLFLVALAALMSLSAAQDPEITEVILPEIKAIGMPGRLNCTVINQNDNPVYWIHKDIHISKNDKIEIEDKNNEIENGLPKYQVERILRGDKITYRLTVNRLERRDAGNYTCQVQITGSNGRAEKDGEMVVLIPPTVTKSGTSNMVTAERGGEALLTCRADGYPTPNITWIRVNGQLLPNGKLRDQNTLLHLQNLQAHDRGIYRCLADNAVRPPAVFDVTLYINFLPVARAIQSSYGQAEGRQFDVTLECRISGWPEPNLKWYKLLNGGSLDPITNTDKHTVNILLNHANILEQQERWFQLVIRAVQANDFGTYQCEGSNTLGASSGQIKLFATSECQGPNCREEQRPEKSAAHYYQTALPVFVTCLIVAFVKTILS